MPNVIVNNYICIKLKYLKAMNTTYHIHANELDIKFVNSLKSLFADKKLKITVSAEHDETEYLLSNPENAKRLLKSIENVKKGKKLVKIDLEKLKKLDNERDII